MNGSLWLDDELITVSGQGNIRNMQMEATRNWITVTCTLFIWTTQCNKKQMFCFWPVAHRLVLALQGRNPRRRCIKGQIQTNNRRDTKKVHSYVIGTRFSFQVHSLKPPNSPPFLTFGFLTTQGRRRCCSESCKHMTQNCSCCWNQILWQHRRFKLLMLIQDSRQSDNETVEHEQSEKHYQHLTLYGNFFFHCRRVLRLKIAFEKHSAVASCLPDILNLPFLTNNTLTHRDWIRGHRGQEVHRSKAWLSDSLLTMTHVLWMQVNGPLLRHKPQTRWGREGRGPSESERDE